MPACARSIAGRPRPAGMVGTVPAGVETSMASPLIRNRRTGSENVKLATSVQDPFGPERCHVIQPCTVALLVAFQVSLAWRGKDQTSRAGSKVISFVAE